MILIILLTEGSPRNGGLSSVGGIGLEPTTSAMSKQCSNQLSYPPGTGAYYKRRSVILAIE
jgi:hypothetical protein